MDGDVCFVFRFRVLASDLRFLYDRSSHLGGRPAGGGLADGGSRRSRRAEAMEPKRLAFSS